MSRRRASNRLNARRYRRLIRMLFSRDVVGRDADEMEAAFLRILELERRRGGRLGAARAWWGALIDGLRSGRVGSRLRRPSITRRGADAAAGGPGRSGRRIAISWLDAKLGVRMLGKHPGLTLVCVFALAVGIPVGVAPWHLFRAMEAPLPVEEGERIRLLRHWNIESNRPDATTSFDLARWREGLESFTALGALRRNRFNVGDSSDESASPVPGVEASASTFDILRVAPHLGRHLLAGDEAIGAPNVAVLGFDYWRARFGGDPGVLGATISVNGVSHTVVGVMPEGFRFPIADQLWLPLREPPAVEPFATRPVIVFGRLADTATPASAEAELSALSAATAVEDPAAYRLLRAEVVPFSFSVFGFPRGGIAAMPEFYLGQLFTLFLLGVAGANVGMLMFARSASRSGEFAVRAALGASRRRLASQMFVESLILAMIAVGFGLLAIDLVVSRLFSAIIGELPYWVDFRLTGSTVLFAQVLAVVSAVVAGVLPAIRMTGKAPRLDIRRAGQGPGTSGGAVSSLLIVADVAVAVSAVGLAVILGGIVREAWMTDESVGIPAHEFLAAEVRLSAPGPEGAMQAGQEGFRTRTGIMLRQLEERIAAQPGVRAVVIADALPRMDHRIRHVELEGEERTTGQEGHRVRTAAIEVDFFRDLRQPILRGRNFDTRDIEAGRARVIVNSNFVANVLEGRNPIGQRLRYRARGGQSIGPWYEIVGVVGALGMHALVPDQDEGVYHPAPLGEIHPAQVGVHLRGDPAAFAARLRQLAAETDPLAVVGTPVVLSEVFEGDWYVLAAAVAGVMAFVGILLALAASGLYAIMSLAVVERTREIGIRTALGASRGSIIVAVARRAALQLAAGAALGMPVAAWLFRLEHPDSTYGTLLASLGPGICILLAVGLLACAVPTLRALRIMPTEALR